MKIMIVLVGGVVASLAWIGGATEPRPLPAGGLQEALAPQYECTGRGADGTPYRAVLDLQPIGEAYRLRWTLPGQEGYVGVGLRAGADLAVAFSDFRTVVGLVIYTPRDGGLHGRFTGIDSETFLGTESCLPTGTRHG